MAKPVKVQNQGRRIPTPPLPRPDFTRESQGAALTRQAHRGPGPNPVRKPDKNPERK